VLRDGRVAGSGKISDLTAAELIRMMIGRAVKDEKLGTPRPTAGAEPVLRVRNLSRAGQVAGISFTLHEGEILGFYGLVGSGRTETARLIIGEQRPDAGEIFVRGRRADIRCIADSLERYRIGYVTENRKEEGLFLKQSVRSNVTLAIWPRLVGRLTRRINGRAETQVARRMVDSLAIKTSSLDQNVENLSGGNQQKVSIAKWLAAECDLLIIDEPTVGVDVGAKDQIHRLIWNLAQERGKAVIVISSDMPEIIRLAGRILIFKQGRIVGEVTGVNDPGSTYEQVSAKIGQCLA
jgi:ribose transport system ATP-binding protein